jgi:ABC-type Fe3+-hydroxamate transport system substrate-binding protein
LIQVGDEPLVIAARRSFLSRALELIGAQNVYADLDDRYPRSSAEDVIKRNPEMIFVLSLGPDTRDAVKSAQKWSKRFKHVQVLSSDGLLRPSLRLLEGVAQLEKAVYGVTP